MATLTTVGSIAAIAVVTSVFVELILRMVHDPVRRVRVPKDDYHGMPGGYSHKAHRD